MEHCMIEFHNMAGLTLDAISFATVKTENIAPPPETGYNKYLKRAEYDKTACREQLLKLVNIDLERFYQFLLLVNLTGGTPEIFGFNYTTEMTIEAYTFLPAPNFNLLIDILLDPFCATQPTLLKYSRMVYPDGSGGGCSGRLIDITAFIKQPACYLEMHAPELYTETNS